ncbi:MAG: tRNA 2-thiouridine(34) synthase MnmA [Candidatus Cloacimonetes bacterium]|nr:tRNA 2-thiouridine(34) synthase MnmA [Candidatus Cloacimonadota bacterium]
MTKKALIAMSGGVDSSVAAYLMKQQGYDCIGINMKLFSNEDIGISWKKSCCSLADIEDASNAASSIDIPFYVNDFRYDFKTEVIDRFMKAYLEGATPNPCIDCNHYVKFPKFLSRAVQFDIDYVVTGHYAKIEYDKQTNRFLLKKAKDESKDQSYFLYTLTQEQLSKTIFPLGNLYKSEVREIARKQGFRNAEKHDSQDICFIPEGDYVDFIEKQLDICIEKGDFIDLQGNILGQHNGIIRYTIGQRRGLGIALNKPMYVHSKNIKKNTVVLCEDHELFEKSLEAINFNWITTCPFLKEVSIRVKAKIRYNQAEEWATVSQISEDRVLVVFDEPQRAIAKGQAIVLYDGDVVVGGGTID